MVINTTPLAAREPYKEAAEASFKTVTDSISCGFNVARILDELLLSSANLLYFVLAEIGTPSTTYNGSFEAFNEPEPRIRNDEVEPGCPEADITCNPATCPCNDLSNEALGLCSLVWSTLAAEPVNTDLLLVPYATTTTSSSDFVSSRKVIFTEVLPEI